MRPRHSLVTIHGADELWTSVADVYRQVGVYTGRILKGVKPVDLPECLLNLSPDLYACAENELFGSLGQPCDASCPWTWRAQRVRVEYPLGGHSIAR